MSEPNQERRRYPRIKAKVPVELVCSGSPPMRTSTEEISLCGCYVETMFTMDIGTKLTVLLAVKGDILNANGIVVTKYPQVGNGIDFIQMHPSDRLKLNDFIAENHQEDKSARAGS
jgi:c-di-GMP-binding flagellar brake protein YcgR